jgi:hypothetical protein
VWAQTDTEPLAPPDDTHGQATGSAACRVTTLVAEAIACCHRLASSSAVSSPPNAEYALLPDRGQDPAQQAQIALFRVAHLACGPLAAGRSGW